MSRASGILATLNLLTKYRLHCIHAVKIHHAVHVLHVLFSQYMILQKKVNLKIRG